MYPEYKSDLELLELEEGASLNELKIAYREMAKVWHPDRFSNDPKLSKKAGDKLSKITVAYKRLIDHYKLHKGNLTNDIDKIKSQSSNHVAEDYNIKPSSQSTSANKYNQSLSKFTFLKILIVGIVSIFVGRLLVGLAISLFQNIEPAQNQSDTNSDVYIPRVAQQIEHVSGIDSDNPVIYLKNQEPISIYKAVDSNNYEAVKLYLELGGSPNIPDLLNKPSNVSIFRSAIVLGKRKIVELMIDNGAELNKIESGQSHLESAIEFNQLDIIELLVANGTEMNSELGSRLIHSVVRNRNYPSETINEHVSLFDVLIKNGANISTPNEFGNYIFHTIVEQHAKKGSNQKLLIEDMNYFLKKGLSLNNTDAEGLTVLDLCNKYEFLKVAELIKQKGGEESPNSPYTKKGLKGLINKLF